MPALPSVSGVLKMVIKEVIGSITTDTILHWLMGGTTPDQSDLDSLAASAFTEWGNHLMPLKCNTTSLGAVEVTDLSADDGLVGVHTGTTLGSLSSAPLPPNCAFVLSHKIARRYRGGHPRTYLSGFPESQVNSPGTLWSTNYRDGVKSAFDSFRNGIATLSLDTITPLAMVSVSYRHDGQIRAVPQVDSIIETKSQPRLCSQRRRLGHLIVE